MRSNELSAWYESHRLSSLYISPLAPLSPKRPFFPLFSPLFPSYFVGGFLLGAPIGSSTFNEETEVLRLRSRTNPIYLVDDLHLVAQLINNNNL